MLFRRRVDPRRHLVLLIMCGRVLQVVILVLFVIEQKGLGKEWHETPNLLDSRDFFLRQFDLQRFGHRIDVLDRVDTDDGKDVGRLLEEVC